MLKMEAGGWESIEEPMVQTTSTGRALDTLAENSGLNPGSDTNYGILGSHVIPPEAVSSSPNR